MKTEIERQLQNRKVGLELLEMAVEIEQMDPYKIIEIRHYLHGLLDAMRTTHQAKIKNQPDKKRNLNIIFFDQPDGPNG